MKRVGHSIKKSLVGLTIIASPNFYFNSANAQNNLENRLHTESKKDYNVAWEELDKGLYLGEINSAVKSEFGDSKITILKINPKFYNFHLISAKETEEENKTAEEWAEEKSLIAVINAGMYQIDGKTNVGYMKNHDFVNNGQMNNYNSVAAFNRKDKSAPEFQIIDLKCQNFDSLKNKYNSFSQGIRMIDCGQRNMWGKSNNIWNIAGIGVDKEGNALFMFAENPTVYDFINILIESDIRIEKAMYLEGGPPASFYLNSQKKEIEKGHEKIPNVIGIARKK